MELLLECAEKSDHYAQTPSITGHITRQMARFSKSQILINSRFLPALSLSTSDMLCGAILFLCVVGLAGALQPKCWLTTADARTGAATAVLEPSRLSSESSSFQAKASINLNVQYQEMLGYGAGLPQASAFVLHSLKSRNSTAYQLVLKKLFTSDQDGAKMNFLRFPIGSCDFSMVSTSYDEVKDDYSLSHFAVDADSQYIIDVLKDVRSLNPSLQIIATPWSAPSWLKVQGTLTANSNDNTLLDTDRAYSTYASYLSKSLEAYTAQGLHVDFLALQNEPLFGNGGEYPGMYLSADNAVKLAKQLQPMLTNTATRLLSYDHNWDVPDYPQTVMADSSAFWGIAWHCYGGDMASAQDALHQSFPNTPQLLTECTGAYPSKCDITQGMASFGFNHEWDMQNILLGAAAHWASAGLKWILALDEHCGPTLPEVTFVTGRPLVSISSTASTFEEVYFNQDYWSIAHMSKFIPVGAHRVQSSAAVSGGQASELLSVAFLDDASRTVTFIAMNLNHSTGLSLSLDDGHGMTAQDFLPPFSTKVYQWSAKK